MPYKEGDISPLTAKAQKQNISALKKTGSIKTVRRYGYQNVADGVMVYVTDPSKAPLSNAHADNLAAGKSLAGALGFERIGYYTGEIRNVSGREIKTESKAIIGKDGTLYINLNADSPFTAIIGASWFENLRKTNTQTAVALIKAYDRYRKLTRSKADISQWIGKQLTGTQTTALFTGNKLFTEELANLMHMDASRILEVIESDPQFSSLIARGDLTLAQKITDSIKGFFTKFGDTIARMTGNTDRRAASALTIAQKNLLIAMRDAPLDGARAMRADAKTAEEYRRIQDIEREIEHIDRLEAERERAEQQKRADRRRGYYEELNRQEAEKQRARENRREWNWGDVPDGEGGNLNSFMSRAYIPLNEEELQGALSALEWRRFRRAVNFPQDSAGLRIGRNAVLLYNENVPTTSKLICYRGGKTNTQITAVFELIGYDWTIHEGTKSPAAVISKGVKDGYESKDITNVLRNDMLRNGCILEEYSAEDGRFIELITGSGLRDGYKGTVRSDRAGDDGTGFSGDSSGDGEEVQGIKRNAAHRKPGETDNNSFMSQKDDAENSSLGMGFDDLNTDNADAVTEAADKLIGERKTSEELSLEDQLANARVRLDYAQMKMKEYGNIPYGGTTQTRKQFELWNEERRRAQNKILEIEERLKAEGKDIPFDGVPMLNDTDELKKGPEPAPIINEDPEVRSKYQELRDKFGTIPQGENVNSRGDVGVPSRTQKNNRVRQGVRTFAEAKATPDEVVGELEREIVNGTFSYTPLSDKAANNYAKDTSALSLIILRQTNGIWRTSMSICRIYREQESLPSAKLSELPTEI